MRPVTTARSIDTTASRPSEEAPRDAGREESLPDIDPASIALITSKITATALLSLPAYYATDPRLREYVQRRSAEHVFRVLREQPDRLRHLRPDPEGA